MSSSRAEALNESRRRAARRAQQLTGRFCEEWLSDEWRPCGGELRYARRVEGELIVSYLQCHFCGNLTPMLEYDLTTGKDRSLR